MSRSIANVALMVVLAAGLNACASDTLIAEVTADQQVVAEAIVTAAPDSSLIHTKVEVKTIAAPLPPANEPENTQEPLLMAPSPPKAETPSSPVPVPSPTPMPTDGYAWVNATMAKHGTYPNAGTEFVIGPMPAGCEGAHGCTSYSYIVETGEITSNYTITLLPDQLTEYLLIHEIGHARGIRDECAADNFARSVLGTVLGYYCN